MKLALFNYSSSGLFHYACSLANALVKLDSVTSVYFFTSDRNNLKLLQKHPKLVVVDSPAPHALLPFTLWAVNIKEQNKIRKTLKKFDPDIINIADTFPIYPLHYFLLKKYRVIFTQHDPIIHSGDDWSLPTRLLQKFLQHLSSRIIVHGDLLKKQLVKQSKRLANKVSIMPMGDFSILLSGVSKEDKTIPRSILFFGRVVYYKGLDTLLTSLKMLQDDNVAFHFILAGPGDLSSYQNQLSLIKNKSIANYFIPDDEVHTFFSKAEIVVLPYREATQSAVVALALAAKKPVIATRVGALPEVLTDGKNSLLVEPNDPVALRETIEQLLNDKGLQVKLVQGGDDTVDNNISWRAIAKEHLELYRSIVK